MAHILENTKWNQREKRQPAPESNDSYKLEPVQTLCVWHGCELEEYFFHKSLLTGVTCFFKLWYSLG